MTPTPEQNAKRTPRTDAIFNRFQWIPRAHRKDDYFKLADALLSLSQTLETELQQLRLAADGLRDAAQERVDAKAEYDSDPSVTCLRCGMADEGLAKALAAYRAAVEGK